MRNWIAGLTKIGPAALGVRQASGHDSTLPEDLPHPLIGKLAARLAKLRGDLERIASPADRSTTAIIRALVRLEQRLLRPYRIAVMGEFNSGKSSVANLLAGIPMLPTGAVSNTRVPTLIRHAREPALTAIYNDGKKLPLSGADMLDADAVVRLDVGLPIERLRVVEIADLPGGSDPLLQDYRHAPARLGVDAALWCTLATQAWKESERVAWADISAQVGKQGLLVVTNKDLLRGEEETKVLSRLKRLAGAEFQSFVFLCTPQALSALEPDLQGADRAALWCASGAERMEIDVRNLLRSVAERRLETIIGAVERTADHALRRLSAR
jgi:hypothetical protein